MRDRTTNEIVRLACAHIEQQLLPAQTQQLEDHLLRDPHARETYIHFLELAAALHWQRSAGLQENIFGDLAFLTTSDRETEQRQMISTRAKIVGDSFFQVPAITRLAAALLCGVLVTYFTALAIFVSLRGRSENHTVADSSHACDSDQVATISDSSDVRWSPQTPLRLKDFSIHEGELLKIESGTIELELKRGVTLWVEGPAQWLIDSESGVTLNVGKLVARVPKEAIGFRVQTAMATIVDLGTEFGVEVDDAGKTEVHVLKGEVIVKNVAGPQASAKAGMRLAAGQAVRVVKGEPTVSMPLDRDRFSQSLNSAGKRSTTATPGGLGGKGPRGIPVSFTRDFNDGKLGPNLELGRGGGSCRVDLSAGTFKIAPNEKDRLYVGTSLRNYATVNFVFEATAIVPAGTNPLSDAFFGMGCSDAAGVQREPEAPNVLAVIRIDTVSGNTNGFETRDSAEVNSTLAASGVKFSPRLAGDTVRLRMTWDATAKQALFEADAHYAGGPFVADHKLTVDGSDNGFTTWNSQLIFGGGNGLRFDDIRVTLNESSEPSASKKTND